MAVWKLPPLVPIPKPITTTSETVQVSGGNELLARLSMLPQVAIGNAMNDMQDKAQEIMDDSKDNYCPFEFGTLRESGVVFPSDDGSEIIMSYGGQGSGAEAYALEQHENLSYDHSAPKHSGIGGPKYLEKPLVARQNEIVEVAGQSLKNTLELTSTGWASGDWKTIRVLRERPAGVVVKSYVRGGKQVKGYYRRKKV